jgi:very-short-patch-repair endonuclease
MPIDWSKVRNAHVKEACHRYDAGEEHPHRPAQNTFLLFEGKRYPAKFTRGLCYEIATGDKLNSNDYSGGMETVRFFRALGFSVEYNRKVIDKQNNYEIEQKTNDVDTKEGKNSSPKVQKYFLRRFLERQFECVETEAKFDWLTVPDYASMDATLKTIYDNLKKHLVTAKRHLISKEGYKDFSTPDHKLTCDFFIASKDLIIEYDERQHFTEQRAKSLAHYPSDLNFGFDIDKWREACRNIKAVDLDPIYRDEQRAFYDSVRDILAVRNGMTIIRVKHGDYDLESESGKKAIEDLIAPKANACISNLEENIEEMACYFSKIQRAYREWAAQFHDHEEVIGWLKENGIDSSKCQKQNSFNLLHSNWNSITIPTLYILVPDCMARMKYQFDKLFQNLSEDQIDRNLIWYLLYFLHPVRHELYYFNLHYHLYGYSPRLRLAKLVRSHRLGLKSAKTYLSKEGRTIDGAHISSCGTMAFKHLHLHPTTSTWGKTEPKNLKEERICNLEIVEGDLSHDEEEVAIALSTKATPSFGLWINYAQCAINEGPIFTLKENKKHSDCFKDIVKILRVADLNQDIIGDKLKEYYMIDM